MEDITSVSTAVAFAQSLLDAKLICHASGNPQHRFLFGFFFYTLLVEFVPVGSLSDVHEPPHATTKAHHSTSGKSSTLQALSAFSVDFQKEWIEVLFIRPESTLYASSRSAFLPTPGLGDNSKASAQREFCPPPPPPPLPLPPPCPLSLTDVVSKAVLDGIFSTDSLKQVFGPDTNANVHVGTEGILRKRHTSIAQESSPQDHCSEWYCLLYDMNYNPTCGFSLEIQWLLLHIYRRASNMGFHFFPVPCYPFGYRGTRIVLDPLRIPIFVPCTLANFVDDAELRNQEDAASSGAVCSPFAVAAHLFPKTRSPSAMSALYEFQSLILSRFGFIPLAHFPPVEHTTATSPKQGHREMEEEAIEDDNETPRPAGVLASQPSYGNSLNLPKGISFTQRTYVHVSGGMFVMIPIYSHVRPSVPRRVSDCCGSIDVPHLHTGNSVSTYLSSARSYEAQSEVGFFWTWNHMLPRKWRGQLTGDEAFQDGMLEDFRRFCSGADDRLASLLSDYRAKQQQQRYSS
ncbi:unnamed protein product [Dibothriocephalus latus]|uniref:DEPDC5 C-terminal domain-containing protein n=1 Tax=Dibothriocephalus latus TaxID=60516 RepID=A0A3P7NKN9_DIBLA|nr:unnamed protein product [Dibothriocephalus latus]